MKTTRTVIALVLALVLATSMAPLSRVHAQGTEVTVDPNPVGTNPLVPMNSFFDVFVDIANVGDLDSWQVSLSYNPAVVAAVNVQYLQLDSCIPSQPQCFDIPRSPTIDNTNGFVVGGQASVFPPGASFSGNLQLMDVTFQALCDNCFTPLHLAQVQLLSFSSTIVWTQADGLFSNVANPGLQFRADLTQRKPGQAIKKDAWTDHNVFKVHRDGNTVFMHSVVENYGNGTPEAALVQYTVFDNDAGALLGMFNSNTGTFNSQFENQTLTASVPIFPVTSLIDDPKLLYWDANGNGVRDLGETVIYDNNGNGVYDTSTAAAIDFLVAGVVSPANQTALSDDSHIRFHDADGNGVLSFDCADGNGDPLDCNETVAYDANMNGVYDPGELSLAGPNPPTGLIIGHTYSVTATVVYDTTNDGTPDTLGGLTATFSVKIAP